MALDSLLTLLKSEVSGVSRVQANSGGACERYPMKPSRALQVSTLGAGAAADTPDTPRSPPWVSRKPAPLLGCTPDAPDTPEGRNAEGDPLAPDPGACRRWLVRTVVGEVMDLTYCPPATREHVLRWHPGALPVEPNQSTPRLPERPLSGAEAALVRAWLAHIGETDPATVGEVMDKCETDSEARAHFLRRAAEVPQDDRRTCRQCINLARSGRCLAAARGERAATGRHYTPPPDRLHRCDGYAPGADDPDRRGGRERWPGLQSARFEQKDEPVRAKRWHTRKTRDR